ncbi:MAG TPA: sigma-70 family RNA polymerase sigma factor [Polyangia bacterium]
MAIDVENLYRTHGPMVLRRCRRLLRDDQRAIDAMQDTFVQVLRRQDSLSGEAPAGLLLRVATNVCLNHLRTTRRHPESPDDELLARIASTEDVGARAAARALLGAIFGREQVSTQAIAVMFLLDGMTYEEIAAEVGLSVSGVRKRLRTLKGRVAELGEVAS